ncbi:4-hydroxy-tetrahydrodipicolinate synthase [Sphingobacterium hungaricum]|uniref:4-hydroxy-tetrahydrodipicolinate synthase n=1 Tax=Sphingobacterium hungaricum TaxID=2082723 RepID=A0A928UT29_9SPHI|nr:4-hydroxy-tetrahydrodipicolinate synthase [Sphingobacterium hungaricum]MBE8712222.1 4-hydroxy-tetrahydrodipicolinate synthase [Sphingobacterium hungaricum]
MNEFHGAGVALVTPFHTDGSIDFESLANLIDYQIASGMNYLVSLGTTGETATLTAEEKSAVWEFTSKQVNGRLPLVAGIGGNNTLEVVKQIKEFAIEGYSAILSVSPYYNKPTQEGIYQHYKAIAEVSPLPIIMYNVPSRTGSVVSAATTVRLARDFKNIVATKEASGNFAIFSEILRDKPEEFLLISGDDPITLPMMALGAVGLISVVGNALPKEVSDLVRLCSEGNFAEAKGIHEHLLKIIDLCFVDGNPAGVKYALQKIGVGQDTLRLPLVQVTSATKAAIENELLSFGK